MMAVLLLISFHITASSVKKENFRVFLTSFQDTIPIQKLITSGTDSIKKTISSNSSNKFFHNEDYSFTIKENDFFYYEDQLNGIKLPIPNVKGQFQLENISTAIATVRQLTDYNVTDEHIKNSITINRINIKNISDN